MISNDGITEILKQQWWEALAAQGADVQPLECISSSVAHGVSVEGLQQLDNDLRFVPGLGVVCLRVCEMPPGTWHIAGELFDRLESLKKEAAIVWWMVLLVARISGEGAQGYILNDLEAQPIKSAPQLDDAGLLIQERRHLDSTRMILSIEKLANILVRRRNAES